MEFTGNRNPMPRIDVYATAILENFVRRFGKRVVAMGGGYSHVRGDVGTRYVYLPTNGRGVALAMEIVAAHNDWEWLSKKGVTVVLRGNGHNDKALIIMPNKPGRLATRVARWGRSEGVRRKEAKAEEKREAIRIERQRRASDSQEVHEHSLEAGERMAAEWLHGALGLPE